MMLKKLLRNSKLAYMPDLRMTVAVIEYEGKHVADFGIRRGSRRDQGHGHIPRDIHLNLRDALSLARCTLSYEQWIQRMKEKGHIEAGGTQEMARSPRED